MNSGQDNKRCSVCKKQAKTQKAMWESFTSLADWKSFPLEIGIIVFVCLIVIAVGIVTTLYCQQLEWMLDMCCCGRCLEAYREHLRAYYDLTPRELENMVS